MVKEDEITVPVEPQMNEAIEGQLGYGDSKAEYIREAVRQRLAEDGVDVSTWRDDRTDGGQVTLAGSD